MEINGLERLEIRKDQRKNWDVELLAPELR